MRTWRLFSGAIMVSSVLLLSAPVASSSPSLVCQSAVTSTWTTTQLANETIALSVNALNIGAMGPAAKAGYGGLLLFGTVAPAKFAAIVATLQKETPNKYAMLVMTDQEGGGVQRLTNLVATLPWAQTMGKNLTAAQITAVGHRVGLSMMAAGINTDLAPVLDVDGRAVYPGSSNPDGYRSFSGVAAVAASDGVAFMDGLRQAGVTSVVKHFPGLGGSTGNTDYGSAATLPWATLKKSGLVPFQAAVNAGAAAVMVSNARVPGLSSLPSSISPTVIAVLRQQLGFTGLIVTDSLSAGALGALGLGVPGAAVRALEAGADLILGGTSASTSAALALAQATSTAIQNAVASGALPRATLVAAATQVLAVENPQICMGAAG